MLKKTDVEYNAAMKTFIVSMQYNKQSSSPPFFFSSSFPCDCILCQTNFIKHFFDICFVILMKTFCMMIFLLGQSVFYLEIDRPEFPGQTGQFVFVW